MHETDNAELQQRLVEVEERLDRVAARFTFGYGTESDRDGWLLWIRQLTAQRDAIRQRLAHDQGPGEPMAPLAQPDPRADGSSESAAAVSRAATAATHGAVPATRAARLGLAAADRPTGSQPVPEEHR